MSDTPSEQMNPVRLPAREVPPPKTISAQAQAYLSVSALNPMMERPDASDTAGWSEARVRSDAMFAPMVQAMLEGSTALIEDEAMNGVGVYVARPAGGATSPAVYLYIHGGAFVFGGGLFAKAQAGSNADQLGCTVVSVDYRMPPEDPFPAAPEDCVEVYRALLETHSPKDIVIGGGSAGGNLAAVATLMIRDQGLPMPAGVVLLTPEVDLTESGDSFRTNELLDVMLKRGLPECNAVYAGGRDLRDPYLSPLFADVSGFPPAFVQTGTRDLFLSNSVLFHRKLRSAGVDADLHVWEAMPHGGFGGTSPEDAELAEETRAFIARVTAR
ncbi:MAG: alpha/beta hydrolase [Sphingomonadales bacterium]